MEKYPWFFRNATYILDEMKIGILFVISSGKYPKPISQGNIAKAMKSPITTINYHILKLRELNMIDENNYLKTKGTQAVKHFMRCGSNPGKKLRAHNIQISFNITSLPEELFNSPPKFLTPFTNLRYKGLKYELLGNQILFYSNNKLIVKIPDIFADTTESLMLIINDLTNNLIEAIKLEFPKIKFDTYEICKIDSIHIAILNSIIAKTHIMNNPKNYHFQDKETGLAIDCSNGIPELEIEQLNMITEKINHLLKLEENYKEKQKLLLKNDTI